MLSIGVRVTIVIRITTTLNESGRTVKVDGRLLSGDTEELVRACQGSVDTLVIDLSDLRFADDEGMRVLKDLRAHGATLRDARLYLSTLLENQADPRARV